MLALGCSRILITGSYPDCPSQSTPGRRQMAVPGVESWHITILPQIFSKYGASALKDIR